MEDKTIIIPDAVETTEVSAVADPDSHELAPLTPSALSHFSPEVQSEILAVAEQIDVLQTEKIMSYGQIPLLRSFEQAGNILKEDQGSSADQEVIRQVIELSKQANESYDDFNLVLKEPNFLQKLLLKISATAKDKHDKDLQVKAITCYKMIEQLVESCDRWIDMLVDGFTKIHTSALQDKVNCEELEKYIVAGRIAEERIANEVEAARQAYEISGLISDKDAYDSLKEGLEIFQIVLFNLEKSRAAFGISIGQLELQSKANKNIQIAVRAQKANSMALAAQQLRNAILNAKNQVVLEGQRSIATLNSELLKKVSENTVLTAEESEKILVSGVYTVEAAREAIQTVIHGCELIEKARGERNAHMAEELSKLETLLSDIRPFVVRLQERSSGDANSGNTSSQTTSSGIKF